MTLVCPLSHVRTILVMNKLFLKDQAGRENYVLCEPHTVLQKGLECYNVPTCSETLKPVSGCHRGITVSDCQATVSKRDDQEKLNYRCSEKEIAC